MPVKQKHGAEGVGTRIQILRKRSGLSIEKLAARADVSVAMISYVERGVNVPSLVTLEKLLIALGTSIADFFTDRESVGTGPVFAREEMRVVSDPDRTYTMLLSHRPGVQLEMFDEHIRPSKKKPDYATLKADVAGYVLAGALILDLKGEKNRTVRMGDAFYVPRGVEHRGYVLDGEEARLLTVAYPASYLKTKG